MVAFAIAAFAAYAGDASAAATAVTCDRVAAPTGSDLSPGTVEQPYLTAKHLVDSLAAGQTGCLRGGTYTESVRIGHGGTVAAPLALTSYPGEQARLIGRLWIALGSDYVTLSHLYLDGTNADGGPAAPNLPSPTVNANHFTLQYNEITDNHTGICLLLGSDWGPAHYAVVDRNRIHDCGRFPATNHDHGIYASWTTGATISNNLIYDNADRGVQLYPNVQQATIRNNVIDGNGQGIIFSGYGEVASNNNIVKNNVITNSKIRYNVESYYSPGEAVGVNNLVEKNCIHGGVRDFGNGSIQTPWGFSISENLIEDPQYIDRAAKNFHLKSTSPCLPITGDIAAEVDGGPATEPAPSPGPAPGPAPAPAPAPQPAPSPKPKPKPHKKWWPVLLRLIGNSAAADGGQTLNLKGAVRGDGHARARLVVIEARPHGQQAWTGLARSRVSRRGQMHLRVQVGGTVALSGDNLELRARVPGIGRSKTLFIRLAA